MNDYSKFINPKNEYEPEAVQLVINHETLNATNHGHAYDIVVMQDGLCFLARDKAKLLLKTWLKAINEENSTIQQRSIYKSHPR